MKNYAMKRGELKGRYFFLLWVACLILFNSSLSAQWRSWTRKELPGYTHSLKGLSFLNHQLGWVVGYDTLSRGLIMKTTNGGDDWTLQLVLDGISLKTICFTDENTGYAAGSKIFKTTNGGTDWIEQTAINFGVDVICDIFCISDKEVIAVGKDHNKDQCLIYRTTDGDTWTKPEYPTSGSTLYAVNFADNNNGWAVGKDSEGWRPFILNTSDGGANWTKQQVPDGVRGELYDVFFFDKLYGWAVGGRTFMPEVEGTTFLKTENGGNLWTIGNTTHGQMNLFVEMVSPTEGYVMAFETMEYGSLWLYHTMNSGEKWKNALSELGTSLSGCQIVRGYSEDPGMGEETLQIGSSNSSQDSMTIFAVGMLVNDPLFAKNLLVMEFPKLYSIDVTPTNVSLYLGETQLFTARGYDNNGTEVSIKPKWSATGGTITPNQRDFNKLSLADSSAAIYTPSEAGDHTVVCQDTITGITDTVHVQVKAIDKFVLHQNHPNPFNTETTIEYAVTTPCRVVLKIFDLCGREVKTLIDSDKKVGIYKINFKASNLSSGIYVYKIKMKDFVKAKKMILLK